MGYVFCSVESELMLPTPKNACMLARIQCVFGLRRWCPPCSKHPLYNQNLRLMTAKVETGMKGVEDRVSHIKCTIPLLTYLRLSSDEY